MRSLKATADGLVFHSETVEQFRHFSTSILPLLDEHGRLNRPQVHSTMLQLGIVLQDDEERGRLVLTPRRPLRADAIRLAALELIESAPRLYDGERLLRR